MVLDEPTNDLDLPTLGVLENFLNEFKGCLLIVSHDRYFMDRLVDHLFIFEGDGNIRDFPGNYSSYRIWLKEEESKSSSQPEAIKYEKNSALKAEGTIVANSGKRKLSFKEQREFDQLQLEISALEKEKREIHSKLNSGDLPYDELEQLSNRIGNLTQMLDEKEMRWLELNELIS